MKKKLKAVAVLMAALLLISIGAFAAQTITTVILFEPDAVEVTEEELATAESVIRARLDMEGYSQAEISREGTNICVEIPNADISDEDIANIGKAAKLEFLDADGNVIMDGSKTYIRSAVRMYGDYSGNGRGENYIELRFTKKGQEVFAAATEAAANAEPDKRYISVALDGVIQFSPNVREKIDAEYCIITGSYTIEEANAVANLINSGSLPFTLKAVKTEKIEKTEGLDFLSILKLLLKPLVYEIFV